MKVLKFGGTSIGTVERFSNAVNIIKNKLHEAEIVVVLSAIGGVTDRLIKSIELASRGERQYVNILENIKSIHFNFLTQLVQEPFRKETAFELDHVISTLYSKLRGIFLVKEASKKTKDSILPSGEYLSNSLLIGALKSAGINSRFFDSKNFIRTDSTFGEANVNFEVTNKLINEYFYQQGRFPQSLDGKFVAVVNGFTGSDDEGNLTTLGRSGSDYTAAIIGAALKVDSVEIWTDVNGVLSADPKIVNDPFPIRELDYNEVAEIASFGAKVIFPKSMEPLQKENIPLVILNSFNPEGEGTIIRNRRTGESDIRVVTSMKNLSLVMLEKQNSKESLEILSRLLGILSRHELTYLLNGRTILQQSISFITSSFTSEELIKEVQTEFSKELKSSVITKIGLINNVAVVSIFNGKKNQYSTNRIFEVLAANKIKIHLFFHRSSIEDISIVIDEKNEEKVINLIHEELYRNETKSFGVNVA